MNRIKTFLKTNRMFYIIYTIIGSLCLKLIGIFIKTDNNVILMNAFGGKKYDDSTKAIYEYMLKNKKYKKFKIYWALDDPNKIEIKNAIKIKTDTLKYFIIALKAKYWITNSAIERGLKFKKKNTIYINTWHGSTIKKMGKDAADKSFKFFSSSCDIMFAQSKYDIDIFSNAFNIPKYKFALVGLPRNDELVNYVDTEINEIKDKLKITKNKKIILYAPTFREYKRDKNGCVISPPINIKKWKDKLKSDYIVIFRAHYEINKILNIVSDDFIKDMSDYNNLNELLKISDILISDYSSIMFDYSILERPIYSYAYDYKEYKEKRGMYIDLKQELPNGYVTTEDKLLNEICNCDFKVQIKKTIEFKNKYIQKAGNASEYIDNIIE